VESAAELLFCSTVIIICSYYIVKSTSLPSVQVDV